MTLLRSLRRREDGAVLTEFGLLLIPLSVLMLGLMDMGYMMYMRSVLQGAVNDVARTAATEQPEFEGDGTLDEKINEAIEERLKPVAHDATFDVDKKSYQDFTGVDQPEKLITDVNGDGDYDAGDCFQDLNENGVYDTETGRDGIGGADDVAVYTVNVQLPSRFPLGNLIGWGNTYDITVRAAVRNQPYAGQAEPPVVC